MKQREIKSNFIYLLIIQFSTKQQSTLERKKKTLSFSRRFPFMKSRDDAKSEDGSDQECECVYIGIINAFIYSLDILLGIEKILLIMNVFLDKWSS